MSEFGPIEQYWPLRLFLPWLRGILMSEFGPIEQSLLIKDLTDTQKKLFRSQFDSSKKDPTTIMALAIVLGFTGVDRIWLGDFWIGVLKLFTVGGCGIFWIMDIFSTQRRCGEYNRKKATEAYSAIKLMTS